MRGLYWFRHNLRLHDNPSLTTLASQCSALLCVYIIEDRWFNWTPFQSKPLGAFRWRFINQALEDLQQNLSAKGQKLLILTGEPEQILTQLIQNNDIDIIGVSRLPAFYEQGHLSQLQKTFPNKRWAVDDSFTLFREGQLPFALDKLPDHFTQFRQSVENISISPSIPVCDSLPPPISLENVSESLKPEFNEASNNLALPFTGGETAGLKQLHYYFHDRRLINRYKETRNALDGWDHSSKLSPWLAQGCISPRRVMSELIAYENTFGANQSTYWLYFELLWREYFQWLLYKYGSRLFHLRGTRDINPLLSFYPEAFTAWKLGNTEAELVNALMQQLKLTGWISNRGRQITASYLVNELGVDWRFGAAWFEEQLIDYDPASNWGNWQYLSGVGTDPRGRRKFDIAKQQKQFDPEHEFIDKFKNIIS